MADDQNMAEVAEAEPMDAEEATIENENDGESKEAKTEDTKAKKNKMKATVFFLPAVHEFKSDMTRYQLSRSVVVGPVDIKDLNKKPLMTLLRSTETIQMGYCKVSETGEYKGYLQLIFNNENEAAEAATKMEKIYKEGVTIKHTLQGSHKTPINYDDLNSVKEHGKFYNNDHAVAIPDLAENVTEQELSEFFPNAVLIYIPHKVEDKVEETEQKEEEVKTEPTETEIKTESNAETESKENDAKKTEKRPKKIKRYAYVCFSSEEEVTAALEIEININDQEYKAHKLESLPPVDQIIRTMSNEKIGNFFGNFNQLPAEKKNRIFALRRQAVHYTRTDYLSEKKMRLLKQKIDELSTAIGQGKRGGRGGKRPRGSGNRGQGTPNKRSRQDAFGYSPHGGYGGYMGGPMGGPGGYGYGGYDEWDYGGYGGYGGGYAGYGGGRGRGGNRW